MKYAYQTTPIPQGRRKEVNEKVLYLIDSDTAASNAITREDIFNAYTGDGGLHGLSRKDYGNYHEYSEAKRKLKTDNFLLRLRCVN